MRHLYPPTVLIVLSFFLSACSPLVVTGSKQIQAGKKEQAVKTLNKAAEDPLQKPIASLLKYRLTGNELFRGTYREIEAAFIDLQSEKTAYLSLPEDKKEFYKKKKSLKITDKSFDNLAIRLQNKALERIETADSLLLIDTFYHNMVPIYDRPQVRYERLLDSLVMHNWDSRCYQTLYSIHKYHQDILFKRRMRTTRSYRKRMWQAYLRDYPLHTYQNYVNDFDGDFDNEYSADCYLQGFIEAVETRDINQIAQYIDTCKVTNMDETVAYALDYIVNDSLVKQLNTAPETTKHRIKELKQAFRWIEFGFPNTLTTQQVVDLVEEQLEDTAPSNRSYWVLMRGLHFLHERRAWDLELELVRFAKTHFPKGFAECKEFVIYNKHVIWFENTIQTLLKDSEKKVQVPLNGKLKNGIAALVTADDSTFYSAIYNMKPKNTRFDVIRSKKTRTGEWQTPVNQRGISSTVDDFPMGVTVDQDYMLTRKDTFLLISAWNFDKQTWSKPIPILKPLPEMGLAWIGEATLSRNGKVVLFEGSRDPLPILNEQRIDLYVMRYNDKDKEWGPPLKTNLGIDNLYFYQARSPHLHVDDETILFSRIGRNSFAGVDLLMSTRLDSTWTRWSIPENIGKEYNGYEDDWPFKFSAPASGKKIYYANDSLQLESWDLPSYSQLPHYFLKKGKMKFKIENGQVKVHNYFPLDAPLLDSCKILPNGQFNLLFADENQTQIQFYVDHPDFYSPIEVLDITDSPDVSYLDQLPKVLPYKTIIGKELPLPMNHPTFKANSIDLSDALKQELRWVAHHFKANKQTLLIGGYASNEGTPDEQAILSEARAEQVKNYLTQLGLAADRIWIQGFEDRYAKDKKINPELTEEGGRRVAIFLKKP